MRIKVRRCRGHCSYSCPLTRLPYTNAHAETPHRRRRHGRVDLEKLQCCSKRPGVSTGCLAVVLSRVRLYGIMADGGGVVGW